MFQDFLFRYTEKKITRDMRIYAFMRKNLYIIWESLSRLKISSEIRILLESKSWKFEFAWINSFNELDLIFFNSS